MQGLRAGGVVCSTARLISPPHRRRPHAQPCSHVHRVGGKPGAGLRTQWALAHAICMLWRGSVQGLRAGGVVCSTARLISPPHRHRPHVQPCSRACHVGGKPGAGLRTQWALAHAICMLWRGSVQGLRAGGVVCSTARLISPPHRRRPHAQPCSRACHVAGKPGAGLRTQWALAHAICMLWRGSVQGLRAGGVVCSTARLISPPHRHRPHVQPCSRACHVGGKPGAGLRTQWALAHAICMLWRVSVQGLRAGGVVCSTARLISPPHRHRPHVQPCSRVHRVGGKPGAGLRTQWALAHAICMLWRGSVQGLRAGGVVCSTARLISPPHRHRPHVQPCSRACHVGGKPGAGLRTQWALAHAICMLWRVSVQGLRAGGVVCSTARLISPPHRHRPHVQPCSRACHVGGKPGAGLRTQWALAHAICMLWRVSVQGLRAGGVVCSTARLISPPHRRRPHAQPCSRACHVGGKPGAGLRTQWALAHAICMLWRVSVQGLRAGGVVCSTARLISPPHRRRPHAQPCSRACHVGGKPGAGLRTQWALAHAICMLWRGSVQGLRAGGVVCSTARLISPPHRHRPHVQPCSRACHVGGKPGAGLRTQWALAHAICMLWRGSVQGLRAGGVVCSTARLISPPHRHRPHVQPCSRACHVGGKPGAGLRTQWALAHAICMLWRGSVQGLRAGGVVCSTARLISPPHRHRPHVQPCSRACHVGGKPGAVLRTQWALAHAICMLWRGSVQGLRAGGVVCSTARLISPPHRHRPHVQPCSRACHVGGKPGAGLRTQWALAHAICMLWRGSVQGLRAGGVVCSTARLISPPHRHRPHVQPCSRACHVGGKPGAGLRTQWALAHAICMLWRVSVQGLRAGGVVCSTARLISPPHRHRPHVQPCSRVHRVGGKPGAGLRTQWALAHAICMLWRGSVQGLRAGGVVCSTARLISPPHRHRPHVQPCSRACHVGGKPGAGLRTQWALAHAICMLWRVSVQGLRAGGVVCSTARLISPPHRRRPHAQPCSHVHRVGGKPGAGLRTQWALAHAICMLWRVSVQGLRAGGVVCSTARLISPPHRRRPHAQPCSHVHRVGGKPGAGLRTQWALAHAICMLWRGSVQGLRAGGVVCSTARLISPPHRHRPHVQPCSRACHVGGKPGAGLRTQWALAHAICMLWRGSVQGLRAGGVVCSTARLISPPHRHRPHVQPCSRACHVGGKPGAGLRTQWALEHAICMLWRGSVQGLRAGGVVCSTARLISPPHRHRPHVQPCSRACHVGGKPGAGLRTQWALAHAICMLWRGSVQGLRAGGVVCSTARLISPPHCRKPHVQPCSRVHRVGGKPGVGVRT